MQLIPAKAKLNFQQPLFWSSATF